MEQNRLPRPQELKKLLHRYRYALLAVLAGLLLLGVGGTGRAEQKPQAPAEDSGFDLEETERKLERTLSKISGAGRVSVVLTLREGTRRVLAQDTRTAQDEQSSTAVIVSQGSGQEQPVPVQNVWPRYQGALVVCDGGDDPGVRLTLVQAVRAVTGLSAERISICKRQ